MKCTRKTEDTLRKIVASVLLLVVAAVTTFTTTTVFIQESLIFLSMAAGAFGIVTLVSWLLGDISFCKGDK